jgi:PAS domain S-box-containing protein
MLASGAPSEIEARLRRFDGVYRWFLMRAAPFRDETGAILRWYGTSTDIHDRKLAEEAMRASEANLRRVIDTIPTLSWCNLPDGPNEFLSKSWHDYTGLSPEEAHGWGWSAAFHPDDLPPLMKRWQELLVSGEPGEIEARLRRHDGVYRWFLIRVAPFRDETGVILRWYGTSTDIHDRKLADEALKASENKFRQIVDSIPGLVCTLDAAGAIEQLNQPLLKYFGKTSAELKGWRMTDAVHPDDLPEVVKAYTHSVTTGTPYEVEHRCRRADGVYRWFQVRALAVRDANGQIAGWYVLLTDIDDRKRAEDAVLANEQNLGLIINTMPVLAWSARADGSADFFNQRWLDYTGLTLSEAHDWGWTSAFHPEDLDRVSSHWRSHILSGEPGEIEARLRRYDGTYRWFLLRGNPLHDESGAVVKWYGTNTDIDDRKRAGEELTRARAELAHVTRVTSLGVLTASIAHEVNQPLSGIVTNASTCLRMLDSDPPNIEGARETARRTIRDGNRASEVVTRLRALFKGREVTAEWVNLNDAAQEVVALSTSELQSNRIVVRHEFAENLPAVKGDRMQLQQVIQNLLRNASDSMSDIEDRPRQLLIRTESGDGKNVQLTVQDTGTGFAPSAAELLFESFYTTKNDGMGIGLSVSRSIIEAHRGRLWASANDGPGSSFAFSIPSG